MLVLCLLMVVSSSGIQYVVAEEIMIDSKHENIRRLLDLWFSDTLVEESILAVVNNLEDIMTIGGATTEEIDETMLIFGDPELTEIFIESFIDELDIEFELDPVLDQLAIVIARYFTESEIDEMLAFYQSKTGKKAILSIPHIVVDLAMEYMFLLKEAMEEDLFDDWFFDDGQYDEDWEYDEWYWDDDEWYWEDDEYDYEEDIDYNNDGWAELDETYVD